MKKILYVLPVIIVCFVYASFAQYTPSGYDNVPFYLKSDFLERRPYYSPDYIDGDEVPLLAKRMQDRVRYKEPNPEVLAHKRQREYILNDNGIELINISKGWKNQAQTETWMAINPTNPLNLIATANDNYYLSGVENWKMTSFNSQDGGRTWEQVGTPSNGGVYFTTPTGGTIFDPGVTFDSQGNAYYSYGFTQTNRQEDSQEQNGVFVVKSTTGGRDWNYDFGGVAVAPVALAINNSGNPFHDRYTMTADPEPTSPYRDNLYVAWQRFRVDPAVVISRSTDQGYSWSSPTVLYTGGTQAPVPTTGPNGEVYVAWLNRVANNNIQALVSKSTNGGASYATPVVAQTVRSIGDPSDISGRYVLNNKQNIRVSSPPQIVVDRSNKSTRGNVYVVQSGRESTGEYGVYVSKSTDGGNTWQRNIRADNNPRRNDNFFASIACDPISGMVAIFYYSSENDPANQGVDGYVAISTDAAQSWTNIRITPETWYLKRNSDVFPQGPGNVYWGDYTHIVAYDSKVYPLFWMPNTPNFPSGDYNLNDLYTALISPAPQTVSDLVGESIVSQAVSIHLTWRNPTRNLLGQSIFEYDILIYRDGVFLAEIKNGANNYTDSDVVDGVTYNYEIFVRTLAGQSQGVTTQVTAGGLRQAMPPTDLTWEINPNGLRLKWVNPTESIDGNELRGLSAIKVTDVDGNQIAMINESNSIQNGANVTANISVQTQKYYNIRIQAVTDRVGIITESDYSNTVLAYAGAALTNFSEDFTDLNNVTPHFKFGDWRLTDYVASVGTHCITSANTELKYLPNLDANNNGLYLAPMSVQAGQSTFSFDQITLIHTQALDYGELIVSTNFGVSWDVINWYDRRGNPDGFTQDAKTSEWLSMALDFSKYVGKTIVVGFVMNSNPFFEEQGWFIDNLSLDGSPVTVTDTQILSNLKVEAFPNPTETFSNVSIYLPMSTDFNLSLYDAIGNVVLKIEDTYLSGGSHNYELNFDLLPSGIYYLRAYAGGVVKSTPIVIAK